MRQKVNTDKSLRGGRSFYYRDIFSGLTNEKMSPALYQFNSLQAYYNDNYTAFPSKLFSLYHNTCYHLTGIFPKHSLGIAAPVIIIKYKQ